MSETPETDQFAMFLHGQRLAPDLKYVTASFSEHMEKERNRWRSVAEQAEKALRGLTERERELWASDSAKGIGLSDAVSDAYRAIAEFDSLRKEGL